MKAFNFEGEEFCPKWMCFVSGSGSSGSSRSEGTGGNSAAVRNRAASEIFSDVQQGRQLLTQFLNSDPTANLDSRGLTPGASTQASDLVRTAASDLFNTHSSTVAQRGGLSPKNTEGIIADASARAAASVLPTTLAQAQQNEQANAAARSNQLATGSGLFTGLSALLTSLTQGSESEGRQDQSSFGFGVLG